VTIESTDDQIECRGVSTDATRPEPEANHAEITLNSFHTGSFGEEAQKTRGNWSNAKPTSGQGKNIS